MRKELKIQTWKKLENLSFSLRYRYPGTYLSKGDLKEGKTLQKFLPQFCNGIFLDYGCGDGKMFKYIKQYYKRYPSLIVGIDPDHSRLIKAKRLLLKEKGNGIFLNTTFDNPIFQKETLRNSIFCIICIQVLGHISNYRFKNILRTFHFLLKPQGILVIAIPVINNEFTFPGWKKKTDFLCLTNFRRNSKWLGHKIILNRKDFVRFTDFSIVNLLPTRYFFINEKIEVGHICNRNKITDSNLGRRLKKYGFTVKKAKIYNRKRKYLKGSGDLMISFIPKK